MSDRTHNRLLLFIAFISGMSVMAMEISAARLLAPYFGTSVFVWTNVIGIVLVALSVGYYVGGKLADAHPKLPYLLYPMLTAGILFSIVPWIIAPIAQTATTQIAQVGSGTTLIVVGSFFVTALLFALPLLLLGMVSPFVIRLFKTHHRDLGSMAGSVFALSTIGSILGTFLPTLWLIPTIGTRATVVVFAALLIVTALTGLVRRGTLLLAFPLIVVPVSQIPPIPDTSANTIHATESPYQYIRVKEQENGTRLLVFNEGLGVQSISMPQGILTNAYYDYFLPLPALVDKETVQVGIIGLAGGTIANQLTSLYGDRVEIDGVEIDPKVIDIAQQFFSLAPSTHVIQQDGRMYLSQTRTSYDLLIIDSYQNEIYIPWTLVTKEFWQMASDRLEPHGMVAVNLNTSSLDQPLFATFVNTMTDVFPYVEVVRLDGLSGWNVLVIGSQGPIDLDRLPSRVPTRIEPHAQVLQRRGHRYTYQEDEPVFTDDWAPVELMTDSMILRHLFHK